jgi:hypothetical protein
MAELLIPAPPTATAGTKQLAEAALALDQGEIAQVRPVEAQQVEGVIGERRRIAIAELAP